MASAPKMPRTSSLRANGVRLSSDSKFVPRRCWSRCQLAEISAAKLSERRRQSGAALLAVGQCPSHALSLVLYCRDTHSGHE